MDVKEQRRLRSRVKTRRHRNRSSDDVRALRRQADRERKRAARQQATESRRSHLICACVCLVIVQTSKQRTLLGTGHLSLVREVVLFSEVLFEILLATIIVHCTGKNT